MQCFVCSVEAHLQFRLLTLLSHKAVAAEVSGWSESARAAGLQWINTPFRGGLEAYGDMEQLWPVAATLEKDCIQTADFIYFKGA